MDAVQLAILIVWLSLFIYLPFGILFYRNRNMYPINGRFPRMSLAESFAVWGYCTNQCFYVIGVYPCLVYYIITHFCGMIFQYGFNYRLVQLLFQYEITKNLEELRDHKKLQDWNPSWYYRYRWLTQRPFWIKLALSCGIFELMLFIYQLVVGCDKAFFALMAAGLVYGGGGGTVTTCLACKMWKYPKDSFGLKREFAFRVCPPFAIVAIFIIIGFSLGDLDLAGKIQNVGLIFCAHPILYFAIVPPYYQSLARHPQKKHKKRERKQLLGVRDSSKSTTMVESVSEVDNPNHILKNWLLNPEGYKLFLDYLKTEFSTENLYFYSDVLALKNNASQLQPQQPDLAATKDQIIQIYHKYLDEKTALSCLNIPYAIHEEIRVKIQKVVASSSFSPPEDIEKNNMSVQELTEIFDDAKDEIYLLMSSDSWGRFQRTDVYEEAKIRVFGSNNNNNSSNSSMVGKIELESLGGTPGKEERLMDESGTGLRLLSLDSDQSRPASPRSLEASVVEREEGDLST